MEVIYIEYFPKHQDIALTIWNLLSVTGYAMQYSWSTSFCVDVKTYIQIGVQLLGFSCYCKQLCNERDISFQWFFGGPILLKAQNSELKFRLAVNIILY